MENVVNIEDYQPNLVQKMLKTASQQLEALKTALAKVKEVVATVWQIGNTTWAQVGSVKQMGFFFAWGVTLGITLALAGVTLTFAEAFVVGFASTLLLDVYVIPFVVGAYQLRSIAKMLRKA